MTDKEIIENNRLIADFMGAKHKKDMPSVSQSYMDGNNYLWIPIHGIVRNDTISTGKGRIMQYNSSWDWLMPVVEKIEGLGYFCMINKWTSVYTGAIDGRIEITSVSGKTKILNTWIAIIDFIKWYNENKEV